MHLEKHFSGQKDNKEAIQEVIKIINTYIL